MLKKILMTLLFVCCFLRFLNANEEERSSLYYLKLGVIYPPNGASSVLPSFGVGARFQRGSRGFDISANLSSLLFMNYASLKGIYLFYPHPEKKHQLYYGIGPGIGYHVNVFPMGGPFRTANAEHGNLTAEGVLGYEFRHTPSFKTFIQLEFSQPIAVFHQHGCRYRYQPGVTLCGGIGF